MTAPQQQHKHVVQPPPSDDPQTSAVAKVLAVAASYGATVAALAVILFPFRIKQDAIAAALALSERRTKHEPRQRGVGSIARQAKDAERYYRAAYIVRAAGRIQADLDAGVSLRDAVRREARYWRLHEAARRQRLEAHKRDIKHAKVFGPILGWYLNPLLNNEIECIRANGHNYDALVGTIIGRPGTVHLNCGCTSGPPIAGAGWVDDAVRSVVILPKPKILKQKKAAAA